jgi:hypothetical protein
MEKVKLLTKISSFQDTEKAFQELEKTLNELKQSVNTEAEGMVSDTQGKSGDIRLTQQGDKGYLFEIRTEDGWKTPVIGDSPVTFKAKPASINRIRKKSITEIETEDTSTGDTKAKKTIYDEKNDEFSVKHLTAAQTGGLPRPDYDSGWVSMTNTDTTGTHDLGSVPIMGIWQVSNDDGVTVQFERIHDDDDNSVLNVTSSAWRIYGNTDYGYWANGGSSFTAIDYTGFKARVLLWK